MKAVDRVARAIDYRLNILGIRVWEDACQLIAISAGGWSALGPRWDLPVHVPLGAEELKAAAANTVRLTAYQYNTERPGSDLVEVLNRTKSFDSALADAVAAAE